METPNLYPLSIGEILDRAFRLYRRHFGLLIGITLAAYVPMIALQIGCFLFFKTTRYVDWIDSIFVGLLVSGALTTAISDIYLGQIATLQESFRLGWRKYGSILGGSFLIGLAIGAPLGVIGCGAGLNRNIFLLMLIFVILPLSIFLGTRWALMVPSIVLEECKASESLARSWQLTDSYFGRVFGTRFVAGLLVFVLANLPQMAVLYGIEFVMPGTTYGPLVETILSQIAKIVAIPLNTGVSVVLFYDLLVRKEGFDLKFQLENDYPETQEDSTL